MKILVTGATGKVGSRLAKRLAKRGDAVRALVRDPARAGDLREAGIELAEGDLLRPDSLAAALRGMHAVIHCAAFFRGATSEQAHSVNDLGSRNLAEAARSAGVKRFVFTSTGNVYGDKGGKLTDEEATLEGTAPYPASKILAEKFLLGLEGLDVRVLRLPFVYGDGDPHIAEAAPMMRTFSPTQRMTLAHHADVARAVMAVLDAHAPSHRIYNVTDDEAPTLAELLATVKARRRTGPTPSSRRGSTCSWMAAGSAPSWASNPSTRDSRTRSLRRRFDASPPVGASRCNGSPRRYARGMERLIPTGALARHVREVQIWPALAADELQSVERLPDGSASILFRGPSAENGRGDLAAAGAVSRAHYKRKTTASLAMAIHFEPGSAYPFFGIPMHLLTDEVIPLEELWGADAEALREELSSCADATAAVRALAELLLARLERAQDMELSSAVRVARAVRRLASTGDVKDVAELARLVGLSTRQLHRAFVTAVGVGPKEYLRMLRFGRAAASLALPGSQVAAAAGYYDQAHLIAEFQQLARMTPRAFANRHAEAAGR